MEQSDTLPRYLSPAQSEQTAKILHEYDVSMVSCLYWRNDAPWAVGWRRVFDSFFLFPVNAKVRVLLEGTATVLTPGEFLMLPDGAPHRLELMPGYAKLEQIALHCHIFNAWRLPLLMLFASPFQRIRDWPHWLRGLQELTCAINRDAELGQRLGEILVKHLLTTLVMEGAAVNMPSQALDPRMARALQLIHLRYMQELTVEDLAQECQLSAVQFRKLFRRSVQTSPKAYLARHRLKMATQLLRTSRLSVKQIAFNVGFRSEHYFHLSFKKSYGRTPSEYRRRERDVV